MNRPTTERDIYNGFVQYLPVHGEWDVKIVRWNGAVEQHTLPNIVTTSGLNEIAKLAAGDAASAANYLVVGTVTATASLGSVNLGEVARKAGYLAASSNEFIIVAATYGGAADNVTSLVLETAGVGNHASSGQGVLWNLVTGVSATLANSDILDLTCRIRVGSHG